jgi:hypothetical protein
MQQPELRGFKNHENNALLRSGIWKSNVSECDEIL